MDSSVSPKDEIWFLRVCHHISNAVYIRIYTVINYIHVQGLSFVVSMSTASFSHRKPASAGTYRGNCRARDSDKRNELYLSPLVSYMCLSL